jgi:hypothetical protein
MCEIQRIGFSSLLSDNDEVFLGQILGCIESMDELSHIKIAKTPASFNFRVAPSNPQYLEPILYEVLKLSNMFKFHLELSKSMKTSGAINFNIHIVS